jgi:hypothetical protein
MPFGKWKDFDDCVSEISQRNNPRTGKPYGKKVAGAICATIERKSRGELSDSDCDAKLTEAIKSEG